MSHGCAAASRACVGILLMAYGFALCYDAIMRWIDGEKIREVARV